MLFEHGTRATATYAPPTVCVVSKRATAVFYFTYDANEISEMKVGGAFNRGYTRLMLKSIGLVQLKQASDHTLFVQRRYSKCIEPNYTRDSLQRAFPYTSALPFPTMSS